MTFERGKPMPFGATVKSDGINFAVFSRNATKVKLLFFENPEDDHPASVFEFDPNENRTGDVWHVFVRNAQNGTLYLYQTEGKANPYEGFRFDSNALLIDPYARALTHSSLFKSFEGNYCSQFPKCIATRDDFDWQGDRPLNYPMNDCIIYEGHLKGLTAGDGGGTYRDIIAKIPYFQELGITSVEFLPIQEFDESENFRVNPKTGEKLCNYWGYSTVNFFAPKASFARDNSPLGAIREFKELVRELHKAKIEVILDIVFNHTAEGNEHGRTFSFRGFDNSIYYMLVPDNLRYYQNFSGCGNTLNCNHPILRNFVLDCLCYWVTEMHVDGFRFDLGSVLGRDQKGNLLENPPVLEQIAEHPVLRNTKIIAEAWDANGAYQVGSFPGGRWAEWNDRFRDTVRLFWRGDEYYANQMATRMSGSSDLYLSTGRKPYHSINFITSHDGFTLNDLVSYNGKHNEENGEDNWDGSNNNCSCNYGFEGPTSNAKIENLRIKQIKNFMLTLLVSEGTPMFTAGDEFRRTQNGNNNAYCQDNPISWIDWSLKEKNREIFDFVKKAIALRKKHWVFRRREFFSGKDIDGNLIADIEWFDELGQKPDWDMQNQFLAYRIDGNDREEHITENDNDFYIMLNASAHDITVKLPAPQTGRQWVRVVDTSIPYPEDFMNEGEEEILNVQTLYILPSRSMAVLMGK